MTTCFAYCLDAIIYNTIIVVDFCLFISLYSVLFAYLYSLSVYGNSRICRIQAEREFCYFFAIFCFWLIKCITLKQTPNWITFKWVNWLLLRSLSLTQTRIKLIRKNIKRQIFFWHLYKIIYFYYLTMYYYITSAI